MFQLAARSAPLELFQSQASLGKWRLIVDLSSPKGRSVNDGIEAELCSLTYLHMDKVSRELVRLGPASLMAKMDVESAYRIVPVDPADRLLLGMRWQGRNAMQRWNRTNFYSCIANVASLHPVKKTQLRTTSLVSLFLK